jgi:phosphoribosylaminoimidazole-succinocarboxamide synthase
MKFLICTLLGVSLVLTSLQAQSPVNLHLGLDSLLQKHVSATGQVNYKGLKADKAALDAYLQVLSDNVPVDSTSRAEQMAYWINAYNAFTLDLIVRNYPTASILRFDNGKTWDVKRIALGKRKYSLNQIENEILRPQFKDPRIHFAINCAAQSCPPLWNHAFTADNLDSALEARTRAFVNDRQFNTLKKQSIKLSKIFDWYAADFGNIQQFINRYADTKVSKSAPVTFNEYNWDLNDAK